MAMKSKNNIRELKSEYTPKTYEEIVGQIPIGSDRVQGGVAYLNGGEIGGATGIKIGKNGFVSTFIRAYLASDATINTGGARKILFDTETYDALNEFDPTTNHRFTATRRGYYEINAVVMEDPTTDAISFSIFIYKNGSAITQKTQGSSGTDILSLQITDVLFLEAGDYIEIYVDSAEAGNITAKGGSTKTFLNIHRIY